MSYNPLSSGNFKDRHSAPEPRKFIDLRTREQRMITKRVKEAALKLRLKGESK